MNSIIWKYISEQKEVLSNIINNQKTTLDPVSNFNDIEEIIITASGSSLNAAMLANTMLGKQLNCRIIIENPFQLRNYSPELETNTKKKILIVLSQTGKSIGTLECLELAKNNNIPTIALTADNNSPIAKVADFHLNILCGDEPVGPKTKGFTATVLTLHLLLMNLTKASNYFEVIEEYKKSIKDIFQTIKLAENWCNNNHHWAKAKSMSVVGFGINFPTAREGTLKILETMQISVMNFDMEEYMHGPHRTIIKDSFLITIDTIGSGEILMNNLINFASTKTKNLLSISTSKKQTSNIIPINWYPLTASWLNAVVILQVISTYFPEINGVDPADPIYGDFATTVGTRIK